MDYNCITRCGFRMVFMSAALIFFWVSRPASAGVIASYTDLTSWQADANAAGPILTTTGFAAESPRYPAFNLSVPKGAVVQLSPGSDPGGRRSCWTG